MAGGKPKSRPLLDVPAWSRVTIYRLSRYPSHEQPRSLANYFLPYAFALFRDFSFFFFFHVVNTTRLPPMPDDFTFPCRLPPFPYSNQDWPSRFIELICYDFLLLSICMFFVHFCVLPYVLAGFQHMQSSQLPSVSFLCFVFFRDCFVKEGKQEQEKLKS